jgi:hypothetical protein
MIHLLTTLDKNVSIDIGSEREADINPNHWFLNYLVDGSLNIFIIIPEILSGIIIQACQEVDLKSFNAGLFKNQNSK